MVRRALIGAGHRLETYGVDRHDAAGPVRADADEVAAAFNEVELAQEHPAVAALAALVDRDRAALRAVGPKRDVDGDVGRAVARARPAGVDVVLAGLLDRRREADVLRRALVGAAVVEVALAEEAGRFTRRQPVAVHGHALARLVVDDDLAAPGQEDFDDVRAALELAEVVDGAD